MNHLEPLLTICIPTYNRGARVYALVVFLLDQVVAKHGDAVELLVVNNCSTDDTLTLITPLIAKGVRLVNRDHHLPSAEANMFASVELCRGRYIWFHGDDDVPIPQTINWLLASFITDEVDMYITNSVSINDNGVTIAERLLKINSPCIDVSGGNIVFACGFLHVLAGISGVVFRRSMADVNVARELSGLQEIYAHVPWLIHSFARGRVSIIAQPLVYYRTDDPVNTLQHFKKYAKKNEIGDHYVWSFGLIKLMNYLLDSGDITVSDIALIYDGRRDGTRFRFIDEMIFQAYRQIKAGLDDTSGRNLISQQEFEYAKLFFYRVDLFSFDTLSILEKLMACKCETRNWYGFLKQYKAGKLCKKFEKVFHEQLADNFYRPLFCEKSTCYTIYRTPVGYVALADMVHNERESILSYLDPLEQYPDILTGAQIETIRNKINQVIEQQQRNRNRTSANHVLPIKQIGVTMQHIGNGINALIHSREREIEIMRQSTYASRLFTYQLLMAPFRRVWMHMGKKFSRKRFR